MQGLQPDRDIEQVARPRKEDVEQEEKHEEATVEKSLQEMKLGGQNYLQVSYVLPNISPVLSC